MMIPVSRAALATHKVRYCYSNHVIFIFNSKYMKLESVGPLQQGFNLEWALYLISGHFYIDSCGW